jgi:hypothetical protein
MSFLRNLRNWLDERLEWDDLIAPLRKKTVPLHRLSYWYFLGGITLFLFVIQVLTGILLLLYYRSGANEAFESVQYIMTRVRFGWLMRAVSQGLPQAQGADMGQRCVSSISCHGIWVQRVSAPVEHAGLLRHQGWYRDYWPSPSHREAFDDLSSRW